MKVLKGLAVLGVTLFGLSGCIAGLNDSYKDYSGAYEVHVEEDSWRMAEQTDAVMESKLPEGSDPVAVGMFAALKMMALGDIKPAQFTMDAPTTMYDVMNNFLPAIPGLASTAGIVRVVDKLVGQVGDETYTAEGDINVDKTEVHSTAIDGGTVSSSYEVNKGESSGGSGGYNPTPYPYPTPEPEECDPTTLPPECECDPSGYGLVCEN